MEPLHSLPKLIPLEYCTVSCAANMLNIEKAYIEHWYEVGAIRLFHRFVNEKLTFKCFGAESIDDKNKFKELINQNLSYIYGNIIVDDVAIDKKKFYAEETTEDADYIEIDLILNGLAPCEWCFSDPDDYATYSGYIITPDILESDFKFSYMINRTRIEAIQNSFGWEVEMRELYIAFDGLKAIHDAITEGNKIPKIAMPDSLGKEVKQMREKNILTENGSRASKETLAIALVGLAKRLSKEDPTTISDKGNIKVSRVVELVKNTIKSDGYLSKYESKLSNLERAIKDGLALK